MKPGFIKLVQLLVWVYFVQNTFSDSSKTILTSSPETSTTLTSTTTTAKLRTQTSPCRQNQRCSYRISKLVENEYNIVRAIMEILINSHWNVTLEFVNLYIDTGLKTCDQYMDNMAVDKVLARDFRHPKSLFRALDDENRTNQSVREQYEAEWFEKFKLIKPRLQSQANVAKCNALGLKLHAMLYQYPNQSSSWSNQLKCTAERNEDTLLSTLLDYYISQMFMKDCLGNLELLALSIRRVLKFDCERAHKFKIAYFTSKYLNMFRTCDPYLTVSDLMFSSVMTCTNKELNGTINRKYCGWFAIVCKYPMKCLTTTLAKSDHNQQEQQHHSEQQQSNSTNSSFLD